MLLIVQHNTASISNADTSQAADREEIYACFLARKIRRSSTQVNQLFQLKVAFHYDNFLEPWEWN